MKRGKLQQLLLLTFGICLGINANAQPFSSSVHKQPADITGIVSKTEFNPPNDAVLMAAPQHINIKFPSAVHLVKLTLRNELRDWVDISFRYSPIVNADFQWVLPDLEPAVYYTADWAILSANDRLVRGSFSFSFGPDAKAPSASRAAEEALLQQRYGDPNIRYVAPPATEIIINQDPPSYDPPFTIQLEIDQDN